MYPNWIHKFFGYHLIIGYLCTKIQTNRNMEKKPIIGEMIAAEARKRDWSMEYFGSLIGCQRNNVYNIFRRNNIDIVLLKRISEILEHNYFEDLAKDFDLARPIPIDEEEQMRARAVNQFMDVVPDVFKKLGHPVTITFGGILPGEEEIPLPDFILSDFNISFTIGQTYEEKCKDFWKEGMYFYHPSNDCPYKMVGILNQGTGFQSFDIAIEYKTKEEWEETIRYALVEIQSFYLPRTWGYLNNLHTKI